MDRRRTARRLGAILTAGVFAVLAAAPATAASPSWKGERTEEFSTGDSVPDGCGAYSGAYTGGKSAWSAKQVTVDDGLLQLGLAKQKTSGRAWTSGGVGCWGWAQKYGKYEVRARVPQGKGIDSYIQLLPTKGGETAWTSVELLAPDVETAYITNGYGTKAETARVNGHYSDTFHTYVVEWAPKYLRITVDGHEIYFSTRSYSGSRWFAMVVSNGDRLTGVPDAGTNLPAQFEIDRIKVSSYTGTPPERPGAPAGVVPRVEGKPTVVPTIVPTAVPAPTGAVATIAPEPTTDTPGLAGGVWPWLLGGSVIAVAAGALLSHPRLKPRQQPHSHEDDRVPR